MDITITTSAYEPLYNTGSFDATVKDMGGFGLYSVSIHAIRLYPDGLPNMLIAWGFSRKSDEVNALTETLLAACELIYTNLKEKQHAN